MILRDLIFAAALVSPIAAFAQGVAQSGSVTPGHPARWTAPGVISDGGGSAGSQLQGSGYLTELGITNTGTPLGINDALISSPYHALTLGANAIGGGVLNYQANGGAQPLPFKICVNGTCQTFPFVATQDLCSTGNPGLVPPTGGGTDGFLRADCTISNSLVDTQTGPINVDGSTFSALTQPGISARQINNWEFYPSPSNIPIAYDAVRGVATMPVNSQINVVNGVGAYNVINQDFPPSNYTAGTAFYGIGIAASPSAHVWGINTNISDQIWQGLSSGSGSRSLNNEFDFNVNNPNSTVLGLILQGAAPAQPAFSVGFECGPLSLFKWLEFEPGLPQWTHCFDTDDGVTDVAISIARAHHASPAIASDPSQLLVMGYNDSSAVAQNVSYYANGVGGLQFQSTAGSVPVGLYNTQIITFSGSNSASYLWGLIGYYSGAPPSSGSPVTGQPANANSQVIDWTYTDSSGTEQSLALQVLSATIGEFYVFGSSGSANIRAETTFIASNMPTSCSGQPTGTLWNSGGAVHVC